MYSFSYLEPVCCSMSSSNFCFLTCIQISQEADQVVWYSHLFQNFPQFIVIHSQRLWHSQYSRNRCFSGTLLLFPWSSRCWQFDLWFFCLFIPIPKKGSAKECSNYHTIALISHTSKVMLKVLHARLQQYVNFQMFKLVLEKAEEPEIKLPTSAGSRKK